MGRPRDKASAVGLLPRMEARGWADGATITYRYLPVGGKWLNLGTDKTAALRKVLDLNGESGDAGTIAELWRALTEAPEWADLSKFTRDDYTQCWRQLEPRFGKATAREITPPVMARYLRKERAAAPVRANREFALMSNLMNVAVERGDIAANPCKQVRRNKERPRPKAPEPVALAKFLEWARARGGQAVVLAGMAQFAALAGSRRIEFRELSWPQVGDDVVRLTRAKQRERELVDVVAIDAALAELLERMRTIARDARVGPVFPNRDGNPHGERGFKSAWSRLMGAAIKAGVVTTRFTFHDLRAFYVTQHKAQRGALPDLHNNPATTARTYDRTREVKRRSL